MSGAPPKVDLLRPTAKHRAPFLDAVVRSRRLHGRFVSPPADAKAFRDWLERGRGDRHVQRLILDRASGEFAGVVNVNEIVRGGFQSGYLGYYAFEPLAGRGYMEAGLRAMMREAFGPLRLHRLEANIQPDNLRSIALVRRLGFRLEGMSPRYLKIAGRWRDHERWAITRERPTARRSAD